MTLSTKQKVFVLKTALIKQTMVVKWASHRFILWDGMAYGKYLKIYVCKNTLPLRTLSKKDDDIKVEIAAICSIC